MSDYIVRATAADSQIRAFAITSKEMVEEARRAHDTSPVAHGGAGTSFKRAAMMGTMMKGEMIFDPSDPGRRSGRRNYSDSGLQGRVKGYVNGIRQVWIHAVKCTG